MKSIESDYKYRTITVDNSGYVRVHEPGRAKPTLVGESAGSSKKVLRFNKEKTKLYFISANDRSAVVEVDLKAIDLNKKKERRFLHGKIIDIQVVNKLLVALSKDGFVEFLDLSLPDYVPPKKKNDKTPVEEEPEPIVVKLPTSTLALTTDEVDEYTSLAYDAKNQQFMAVGYRYYAPQDKAAAGSGNTGRSASSIGFTHNVVTKFTAADPCIVSADVKIEGDKCRTVSPSLAPVQAGRRRPE